MKFEDYSISLEIKNNLKKLGFVRPTDIQFKSIPPILKGEDVLAIAQTGTGKTAAFAIPVISILHRGKRSKRTEGIRCVIMVPTHELAIQITEVFKKLANHTKVIVAGIYGGVEQDPQIKKLEKGIDILVATPGRLFDLVSQKHILLDRVSTLILDEADKMLDLGFYKDIQDLIRYLPHKRQTLFFSATIDEKIKKLAYSLVHNPIRIQISPKDPVSKNVDHFVTYIEMDDKRFFLERLAKEDPERKILVFVRTKVRAERVCSAMARIDIASLTIHGDKTQKERDLSLTKFKSGEVKMLITTDVSARGIDIPGINLVVNYDLPDHPENYVHRVGRTGRGKSRGHAISFCSTEEKEMLSDIQQYTGTEIKKLDIGKDEYEATKDLSEQENKSLKEIMKEIELFEKREKKFKKNKKK